MDYYITANLNPADSRAEYYYEVMISSSEPPPPAVPKMLRKTARICSN
jgi:hypothetical protein